MQKSPIEFSRYWSELMAAVNQSADTGLLVLTRLWSELEPCRSDPRFAPYFDEYRGRLESIITESNLRDFGFDDLKQLRSAVSALGLTQQLPVVVRGEAKLWAYVGEPAKAIEVVAQLTRESPALELSDEDLNAGSEQILLELAISRIASSAPQTSKILTEVLAEWQTESSALSHDSCWCMLVQLGPHLGGGWGRLLKLKGDVDLLHRKKVAGNGGPSDQVTFAHQLRSPDDPAITGVYDSLAGIRKALAALGLAKSAREKSWSVRLEFEGGNHQYHGDSLGLAAGLLTYAGLLKDEFLRHERKLSGEVGFTGGVDADGHLTPVNNSTLKDKVERAFFSHLKYLVVPKANEPAAREVIADLNAQYSRRRIHLMAAESIGDVVEDRNLVRPEKLCPAAYIVKGARKYSRATRVQVPLLVVLTMLLVGIFFDQVAPEGWKPWGDTMPSFSRVRNSELEVYNSDSVLIWKRKSECPVIEAIDKCVVEDIDGDSQPEIVYGPNIERSIPCSSRSRVFVYSTKGELRYILPCAKLGAYYGDTTLQFPYSTSSVRILGDSNRHIILTEATGDYPARMHIRFWSSTGDSIGWYINQGYGGGMGTASAEISGDSIAFLVYNNRIKRTALLLLNPIGARGVSPPYDDPDIPVAPDKAGNQLAYVVFPYAGLNWRSNLLHSHPDRIYRLGSGFWRIDVCQYKAGQDWKASISFFLDKDLRVTSVVPTDEFILVRDSLLATGLLSRDNQAAANPSLLIDSVKYWTDSGWVAEGALRDAGQ